jgi:hypothetical protein
LKTDSLDYELFRVQAIRAAGLEGHPKANDLYEVAWGSGWEGGKEEVLCHLCDLAEMLLEE